MDFRLLGPVEAWRAGRLVDVGHARQKCVLAVLLVEANKVVSADQLMDRVWGERPPQRGRDTLYSYLSRLRRVLPANISRRSGGYVLAVEQDEVDLHVYRDLVARARAAGDPEQARVLFAAALDLWRGEALATLDTPWLVDVRRELQDDRWAVQLDHIDAVLDCGGHTGLLPALAGFVEQHPHDERLAGQYMLALYRCGRQADALDHYQRTRTGLVEELGTEPSPPLQRLYQEIVANDPRLSGRVAAHSVPRQLPAAPRSFIGRADELKALSAAMDAGATVAISAIGGAGGIGKTWLALHWAHQHLDRFPDGQLFVNLRGFDPSNEPMSPAVALRGFVEALGADSVPMDLDALAALYRSLINDRKVLVVLDNARDSNQVTPLLPGSPSCGVLITSRRRLAGLVTTHGAQSVSLDTLDLDSSKQLLGARLGSERISAEPAEVADILRHCAGLPLAVGMVAARATLSPDLPLALLAHELQDHAARLDALNPGESDLRAVFSTSCQALSSAAMTTFGLLGLAPGPDCGLAGISALIGRPAGLIMRELEDAHLVTQAVPGRYRMHDLVRLYASELGDPLAVDRLVDFYLRTAYAGDRLLAPQRDVMDIPFATQPFVDEAEVLAWFDVEHPCVMAAQQFAFGRGNYAVVPQLAWAMDNYLWRRGRWLDQLTTWQLGLAAAEQLGDTQMCAKAHRILGATFTRAEQFADAVSHLTQALTLVTEPLEQAGVQNYLAETWERQGELGRALEHAENALRLYETLDKPLRQADALNSVGFLEARLGRYEQARLHCEAALSLYGNGSRYPGAPGALDSLGYIARHAGNPTQALDYYKQAQTLFHDIGNTYEEANTLANLGDTYTTLGDHVAARQARREAIALYQAQGRTMEAERLQREL
ncbi:BTAD domain-containing putative transcriptional regulator [Actinocrispum sp. NPDC049592]|uniref:AfsR/SARP family transcriptional regulator n=1 Tax=Actinocrispum sp. NPDC049592 TaxID=3154835 RepID=UPI003449DC55